VTLLLDFGAFLSRAKGDVDSAMHLYRKAAVLSPESPRVLAAVAYFLSEEGGSINESKQLFAAAIKLEPKNPLYLVRYAKVLRKSKQLGQAELMYKVALDCSLDNRRLHPVSTIVYISFLSNI
jgi:tetratricopeptide (TPR) repeat protein